MREELVRKMKWIFALSVVSLMIASCTNYQTPEEVDVSSCEGCHTNLAHLKEVFTPDTAEAASGCGGEAPHYEPWERVEMTGDGYEDYKTSSHGSLSCTSCHGGIDGTDQKDIAHSEDFIRHPSDNWETTCLPCHENEVKYFANSLHNGTGQKRKVTIRSGLEGPHEFDMLSEQKKEGYNNNCATCHGTCGSCHVVRPLLAGGGLANGHEFIKTPDMKTNCIKCHSSRGGHGYLGIAAGTEKDVHYTSINAQFDCLDCHSGEEIHGSADSTVTHRYEYKELPKCSNCHTGLAASNEYHSEHLGDFNCQVCHSQDYNNCGSCHVHGDGARVPSYLDFKIALNPIPDVKKDFDFVLVRRTLTAPDNWSKYGVDDYANFDAFPSYNFTTPHNILKLTSRTDVGAGNDCSSNCHIRYDAENDTTYNENLYLFAKDMDVAPGIDWETSANASIVVDGQLPASWTE